jgi:hypothetical protein
VEQMRLEVLHKEFMLLTPFHSSRKPHTDAVSVSPNGLFTDHLLCCCGLGLFLRLKHVCITDVRLPRSSELQSSVTKPVFDLSEIQCFFDDQNINVRMRAPDHLLLEPDR